MLYGDYISPRGKAKKKKQKNKPPTKKSALLEAQNMSTLNKWHDQT